jgi:hypothetical protein
VTETDDRDKADRRADDRDRAAEARDREAAGRDLRAAIRDALADDQSEAGRAARRPTADDRWSAADDRRQVAPTAVPPRKTGNSAATNAVESRTEPHRSAAQARDRTRGSDVRRGPLSFMSQKAPSDGRQRSFRAGVDRAAESGPAPL